MLVGKKISFNHTVKCEPYKSKDDKRYLETKKIVIDNAEVIDKYRGSTHSLDNDRGLVPLGLVDFYLVSKDDDLYHVLPKDIIKIY